MFLVVRYRICESIVKIKFEALNFFGLLVAIQYFDLWPEEMRDWQVFWVYYSNIRTY